MASMKDLEKSESTDPLLKEDAPRFQHSVDEVTWSSCWSHYYRGLSSKDPELRRRSRWIIYGNSFCCVFLCVVVVLVFTVVIPMVMQSIVDGSTMEILNASITNPTNATLSSSVLHKFTHCESSVSAKAKVNELNIKWNRSPILSLSHTNTLTVADNKEATLTALATVTDQSAMVHFNEYLIANPQTEWEVEGSFDLTFLVTSKVNFHKTVTLQGYNNFSIQPQILHTNVTQGFANQLSIVAKVVLFSESTVSMEFGQSLFFVLEVNGTDIGIGELPNFVMSAGPIDANANLVLTYNTPKEYQEINYLISQFASGLDANATMKNFFLKTPVTWLSPALSTIQMFGVLPGCDTPLVQQINLYMKKIPENLPFTLQLYNPQPVPLKIDSIVGSLYYLNVKIALVDSSNLGIVVPPLSVMVTKQIPSETVNTAAAAKAFNIFMVEQQGPVDLYSTIVGGFDDFVANINYVQKNVTMIIVN